MPVGTLKPSADVAPAGVDTRRRRLGLLLATIAVLLLAGWAVFVALIASDRGESAVQVVELIGPPPEDEPEEEPEFDELTEPEVVDPETEATEPEAADSDDRLGLDAAAGAGADDFGLAAKRGGRDITSIGGEGGPNPLELRDFVAGVRAQIERNLSARGDLRHRSFVAVIRVWVSDDGLVTQCDISRSSGDARIDAELEAALATVGRVPRPPDGTPQPVWLRVTSSRQDLGRGNT
jgi:periplasmic protein TonB